MGATVQVAVIPIHLGVHLTKLLGARALSAEGLARAANLPTTVVDALIGARQILTADIAVALAEVLGVPALELLELQRNYYVAIREIGESRQHKAA